MNTHSKYDWEVLRSSAEVPDSVWDPIIQTDLIYIDTSCKDTKVESVDVMRDWLSANDETNYGPIRAAPGMTYDHMVGHPGGWVQGVQTDFGVSLCRKMKVNPHPDKQYAFLAEIEISNIGRQSLTSLSGEPYAGQPAIRINVQSTLQMKPLFRIESTSEGASLNLPGDDEVDDTTTPQSFYYSYWAGSTMTEVGGKAIDIAGQPVNWPVESRVITLEVLRRWGHLKWPATGPEGEDWLDGTNGSAAYFEICLPNWDGRIGRRNIDSMLGFSPGFLKLDAINVLPYHHDFKMYQYVFTYDEHKHAQQYTPVIVTGGTTLDDSEYTSTRGSNANEVYWNQPYIEGFRYQESDWGAAEWDYLETFNTGCD